MCGSIYRSRDALALLPLCDLSNPNDFEISGNNAIAAGALGGRTGGGCEEERRMGVVTINRVQALYAAPVFECEMGLGELDGLFREGLRLDPARYGAEAGVNAVHVGGTYCTEGGGGGGEGGGGGGVRRPPVSVLLPVRTGPAAYAREAAESILAQDAGLTIEVVVVDDGCEDGSVEAIEGVLKGSGARESLTVKVVRPPEEGRGLAAALNFGLEHCTHGLVARMDADDVMEGRRLRAQLEEFGFDPELVCLGSAALLFSGGDRRDVIRAALYVTDAEVSRYAMAFSCTLAHPSVMLMKEAVRAAGGWPDGAGKERVEDYCLWLALVREHGRGVRSLGAALLRHRKHGGNVSRVHRAEQERNAARAGAAYLEGLGLGDGLGRGEGGVLERLQLLRRAAGGDLGDATEGQIKGALELLRAIESWFAKGGPGGMGERGAALVAFDVAERARQIGHLLGERGGGGEGEGEGEWDDVA
jgi:hypothetical protein